MEILWLIIASLFFLAGFWGLIIPIIPDLPIIWLGVFIYGLGLGLRILRSRCTLAGRPFRDNLPYRLCCDCCRGKAIRGKPTGNGGRTHRGYSWIDCFPSLRARCRCCRRHNVCRALSCRENDGCSNQSEQGCSIGISFWATCQGCDCGCHYWYIPPCYPIMPWEGNVLDSKSRTPTVSSLAASLREALRAGLFASPSAPVEKGAQRKSKINRCPFSMFFIDRKSLKTGTQ